MDRDECEEWRRENRMKCNIWATKHFPPTELVACPHASVHKLFDFLTLALHDNIFNNKSFHDVKYISSS